MREWTCTKVKQSAYEREGQRVREWVRARGKERENRRASEGIRVRELRREKVRERPDQDNRSAPAPTQNKKHITTQKI